MKSYMVNEVFYSLQGEGHRAGSANVFVRFAGCNMRCRMEKADDSPGGFDCDTEFVSGMQMGQGDLVEEIKRLTEHTVGQRPGVIFTGGEPLLQLQPEIVRELKASGFTTCCETNGSIDPTPLGLDYVACSPKVAEHAVRALEVDELRYVRSAGQGLPKPRANATHYFLSPAFSSTGTPEPGALEWCMRLVRENPRWRLSVQQHKQWRVR